MKIWKIISIIRIVMLLFLCVILVNNSYYIEGGLIGIYILSEVLLSRLREVQLILDNLKKEKENK